MLIDKDCYERGCACYDDRVDKGPVEVVRKKWVGLTDEEMIELGKAYYTRPGDLMFAVEAKLKEKNSG